eukprot:scaffold1878_cov113-Isochrysis_galbana.AAC.4
MTKSSAWVSTGTPAAAIDGGTDSAMARLQPLRSQAAAEKLVEVRRNRPKPRVEHAGQSALRPPRVAGARVRAQQCHVRVCVRREPVVGQRRHLPVRSLERGGGAHVHRKLLEPAPALLGQVGQRPGARRARRDVAGVRAQNRRDRLLLHVHPEVVGLFQLVAQRTDMHHDGERDTVGLPVAEPHLVKGIPCFVEPPRLCQRVDHRGVGGGVDHHALPFHGAKNGNRGIGAVAGAEVRAHQPGEDGRGRPHPRAPHLQHHRLGRRHVAALCAGIHQGRIGGRVGTQTVRFNLAEGGVGAGEVSFGGEAADAVRVLLHGPLPPAPEGLLRRVGRRHPADPLIARGRLRKRLGQRLVQTLQVVNLLIRERDILDPRRSERARDGLERQPAGLAVPGRRMRLVELLVVVELSPLGRLQCWLPSRAPRDGRRRRCAGVAEAERRRAQQSHGLRRQAPRHGIAPRGMRTILRSRHGSIPANML